VDLRGGEGEKEGGKEGGRETEVVYGSLFPSLTCPPPPSHTPTHTSMTNAHSLTNQPHPITVQGPLPLRHRLTRWH